MSDTVQRRPMRRDDREPRFGFWRRTFAMMAKEFIQLKRDRITFAMIVAIPVMQLLLFGYAINTTPRHLPAAVLLQEDSDLARSILKALENTAYFRFTHRVRTVDEFDNLLLSGEVLFGIEIPRGFERAVRRGERPALLVAADATDPVAASSAVAALGPSCRPRWRMTASPASRPRRRSRSASTRATIRPARRGSTSCPASSAPS